MIALACERGGAQQARAGLRTGSRDERKLKLKFSLKGAGETPEPSNSDSRSSFSIAAHRRIDRVRTNAVGCEFDSRLHLLHGAVVQRKNTTA
ncbi:hypothetical protein [Streptomyces sp. HO565]|uniref:hypothetical protein n=1 Tax=Streptomyces sp. HO565 TaxID=2857489 RepID=UPI0038B661AC